jgi:aspartyl-tRNA(Asn)/glutamyl-tRNA(Gln) amidotransferase subunit B
MSRASPEATVTPEMIAKYEPVIGLEVHVQLKTLTKAFCACSTQFGDPPNSNTCPVCLGLPGALPVLNRAARDLAVRAALALGCKIQTRSVFARKNYFYPDLPKGYQISQYELPLALAGSLEIEVEGAKKKIGITRVHMEEDAAKNLHEGFPDSDRWSYIDFNRCGMPLIEIVSEPDIRTAAEAYSYLTTLKQVLEYTDVSDSNALEYEIERQIGVLESGGSITQETRLWNVAGGRTESMRSKEFAHDYRYFPDPDLLPLLSPAKLVEQVEHDMPELPSAKRARFIADYGISAYDAGVLTSTRALASYFEATIRAGGKAKSAAAWISVELLRRLNDAGKSIEDCPVSPEALAGLLVIVERGEITAASGKKVFLEMFDTGKKPEEIIAAGGMAQISDTSAIETIARAVIAKSPDNLAKYKSGNEGVFKFFVGQVMRETKGQANPQVVNDILKRVLAEA